MTTLLQTHVETAGRDGLCEALRDTLAASRKQVQRGTYRITVEKMQQADIEALEKQKPAAQN